MTTLDSARVKAVLNIWSITTMNSFWKNLLITSLAVLGCSVLAEGLYLYPVQDKELSLEKTLEVSTDDPFEDRYEVHNYLRFTKSIECSGTLSRSHPVVDNLYCTNTTRLGSKTYRLYFGTTDLKTGDCGIPVNQEVIPNSRIILELRVPKTQQKEIDSILADAVQQARTD